jgi:hypothetical protein
MAKALVCDRCGTPTARIVAKLFLPPKNGRSDHSYYTAHADIGECCGSIVAAKDFVRWQKRKKQKRAAST